MRGLDVALGVEQQVRRRGGGGRSPRAAGRRVRLPQHQRRALQPALGEGTDERRPGQPTAAGRRIGGEASGPQQPAHAPDDVAASQGRVRARLDGRGHLLRRLHGRLRQVEPSSLDLSGEHLGQTCVGRAPLVVRRLLHHHGLDHWVPEYQLPDPLVDDDEVVPLRGSERLEPGSSGRREHGEVARPLERRQKQEQPGVGRQAGHPLVVQPAHRTARPGGHRGGTLRAWVSRDPSAAANSRKAGGLPCASSTTSRRTRAGRWAKRAPSRSSDASCPSAGTTSSRQPAPPTKPPAPVRAAPSRPTGGRQACADEADHRGGGLVEPQGEWRPGRFITTTSGAARPWPGGEVARAWSTTHSRSGG